MQTENITSKGVEVALGVVRQQSIDLLDQYFKKLLDELIECSQSSTFIGSQHEYFYARAKISQSRKDIATRFVSYIENTFQQFSNGTLPDSDDLLGEHSNAGASLTLVEDDALEERVILTTIRQRAEARYSDAMWALNRRFALLNRGREVTDQSNPLAPSRFCFALKQGMQTIDVSSAAKAEIYRMFERVFVDHVGRIYSEVNSALIDLGVLPNLRHEVVKSRDTGPPAGAPYGGAAGQTAPAPMTQSSEPGTGWLGGGGRANLNYHQQVYQDISSLQDQLSGAAPAGAVQGQGGGAGAHLGGVPEGVAGGVNASGANVSYSVNDLTSAISQIQMADWETAQQIPAKPAAGEQLQPRLIAQVTELLLHNLTQMLGAEEEPAFKTPDRKTIDLVGMIFEYMLNDDQLPDSIKALLSYLHTPFLKLAFADSDFFEQNEHPARQLLNRLAEAGTRWVNRDGTSEYGVYARIREAVERLLKDVSEDARPFTEELLSFNTFVKRVELKITTREKRATEQAKGEDRMQEVKEQVHRTVQEVIDKRDLPSAILMFLLQPWSDYMAFVLLRFGEKSEQWKEATDVIDKLLWGLSLGEDEEQKARWKEQYPQLQATITKGFDCIGYDEGRRRKMTSAVDYVYELYLQGLAARPAPAEVRKKLEDSADRNKTVAEQAADLNESERQHLEILEQISFGTWFDMGDGNREKVVWYNLRTMQFLFVNQSGHRTGMRTGEEIARKMEAGIIHVIDGDEEKPLMDRTLEQIRADLSASAQKASAS